MFRFIFCFIIYLFYFYFFFFFFFFNDTATTEIYTLSLHDALPPLARLGDRRRDEARHRSRPWQSHRGRCAELVAGWDAPRVPGCANDDDPRYPLGHLRRHDRRQVDEEDH